MDARYLEDLIDLLRTETELKTGSETQCVIRCSFMSVVLSELTGVHVQSMPSLIGVRNSK